MTTNEERFEAFLRTNPSVEFIRLHWIDFSGVLRTRFVPKDRCLEIARGNDKYSLAVDCMIIPISTAPVDFPTGQDHEKWHLEPDWSSFRPCGVAANHATVMCFVDLTSSETRRGRCPRTLLYRAVERLDAEHDRAELLVGFEIEFVLLNESLQLLKPLDSIIGNSSTSGLRGQALRIVDEIIQAMNASSIRVWHFHVESPDQLEIALAHQPAIAAVDSLMLAQEIIRTIAVRHHLRASMTPKPVSGWPQNGCHMHMSITDRLIAGHFLASVLSHMEALCAIGMANFDSYYRAVEDGAGKWIGWGTYSRDLPVRRISDHHLEIRALDGTANVYLFLACVLSCGLDGLANKTALTWKDCRLLSDNLDANQRAVHGIDRAMPRSLKRALECLQEDARLQAWMTSEIFGEYAAVKNKEVETFSVMSDEQRRARFLGFF